jgi:hypothetical protein
MKKLIITAALLSAILAAFTFTANAAPRTDAQLTSENPAGIYTNTDPVEPTTPTINITIRSNTHAGRTIAHLRTFNTIAIIVGTLAIAFIILCAIKAIREECASDASTEQFTHGNINLEDI